MLELLLWLGFIAVTMYLAYGVAISFAAGSVLLAWGLIAIFALGFLFACVYVFTQWFMDFLNNL